MKLQILQKINPLFTTRSGIAVSQLEERVVPQHILVHHPVNGQSLLDGKRITWDRYKLLQQQVFQQHPDSLVIDNVFNRVFIYPQTPGETADC